MAALQQMLLTCRSAGCCCITAVAPRGMPGFVSVSPLMPLASACLGGPVFQVYFGLMLLYGLSLVLIGLICTLALSSYTSTFSLLLFLGVRVRNAVGRLCSAGGASRTG